jgi:DNA-binding protein H-NS
MPDLSTIRVQVQERLKELERLIAPLRAELDELASVSEKFTANGSAASAARTRRSRPSKTADPKAAKPRAARPANRAASSRRPTGGGVGRAQQAVKLIADNPGMTVPEMAKAMGIGSNYLYRVLPRLQKDGKVSKQGKGYHAVDVPATDKG